MKKILLMLVAVLVSSLSLQAQAFDEANLIGHWHLSPFHKHDGKVASHIFKRSPSLLSWILYFARNEFLFSKMRLRYINLVPNYSEVFTSRVRYSRSCCSVLKNNFKPLC